MSKPHRFEFDNRCAVATCIALGRPQVCCFDGEAHSHGRVHYEAAAPGLGLAFRPGWHQLCDAHYNAVLDGAKKSHPHVATTLPFAG